jgi:hypothetical protein
LPNNHVSSIAVDNNQNIWIGMVGINNGGLVKFDGINWTVYDTDNSDIPCNTVHSIAIDNNQNKWIGTDENLIKFDGNDWTDHNSHDPGYAYTGHTFDFSLKLPFDMFDRETIFRTGYKLQTKGYQLASRRYTGDETRSDKRHTVSASWQVPIVKGIYVKGEIEYIASNSNYEIVDYNETISTASIGWEF